MKSLRRSWFLIAVWRRSFNYCCFMSETIRIRWILSATNASWFCFCSWVVISRLTLAFKALVYFWSDFIFLWFSSDLSASYLEILVCLLISCHCFCCCDRYDFNAAWFAPYKNPKSSGDFYFLLFGDTPLL